MDFTENFYRKYLSEHSIDKDIILKFFVCFSRLEYAIKSENKFLESGDGKKVQIKWEEFFTQNSSSILNAIENSTNKLFQYQIKTQYWQNGNLHWAEKKLDDDKIKLIKHNLLCLRNNLFHGGKAITDNTEYAADKELLEAGLDLLNILIGLNKNYSQEF
jgi:hypothetical protein